MLQSQPLSIQAILTYSPTVDIGRIQRLAGEAEPHTVTFITLFRVLLPWFANRVLTDFAQLISETLAPLLRRVAAPISSVGATGSE